MNNARVFLGARDLCAFSRACARFREIVPDATWSQLICARFPMYPRALIGVARETLLLLEDRAHDGHAAVYHARSNVKPEEIADPASRIMMSICSAGFIDGIISISREHLILRGDIIVDDYGIHALDAFIYDGEFAHRCKTDIFLSTIELPRAIKIGAEFDADYFKPATCSFTRVNVFLDTNRANYSSIDFHDSIILNRGRCVLVRDKKRTVIELENCNSVEFMFAIAKNYSMKVGYSYKIEIDLVMN